MDTDRRLQLIEDRLDRLEQALPVRAGVAKQNRKHPLPADWQPRQEDIDWCKEALPNVIETDQRAQFIDYWHGNGECKVNWDSTYRNWLRRSIQFSPAPIAARIGQPNGRAATTTAINDARRNSVLDKLAALRESSS